MFCNNTSWLFTYLYSTFALRFFNLLNIDFGLLLIVFIRFLYVVIIFFISDSKIGMNNNEDFNYLCRKTLDAHTMNSKSIKTNLQKKNQFIFALYTNIYIIYSYKYTFESFKNKFKF